jgi:hypothetical protein
MDIKLFPIWLDGFLVDKDRDLTELETKIINDKLNSCFNKVTPDLSRKPDATRSIELDGVGPALSGYCDFAFDELYTEAQKNALSQGVWIPSGTKFGDSVHPVSC